MRISFIVLIMLSSILGVSLGQCEENQLLTTMLVYDVVVQDGQLRNYRNVMDCLHDPVKSAGLNLQGFADLKLSGSAQFSALELPYILQHATGQVFIVDLRQESHGFVNGDAVTWYSYRNQANSNKTPEQIHQEENKLLVELANGKNTIINNIVKIGGGNFKSIRDSVVDVKKIESEQGLVTQAKANYVRFYILDRHKPNDEQVDAFIDFVRKLPQNAWLHFHCRAGKGRTTTFMVMYDMICNAMQVSFEDIVNRHIKIGGSMLNKMPTSEESQWTLDSTKERYKFIQEFYQYVTAYDGYGKQKWSAWIKGRKNNTEWAFAGKS